jgi:DNA-binding CsgD family transcriptional regulator
MSKRASEMKVAPVSRVARVAARGPRLLPDCPLHTGSHVRPYRATGPNGPGVYPQCVPRSGELPHLLSWVTASLSERRSGTSRLSSSEREILEDASQGMTASESAAKRGKGSETVKSQRSAILAKLGARNMAHAVSFTLSDETLPIRVDLK